MLVIPIVLVYFALLVSSMRYATYRKNKIIRVPQWAVGEYRMVYAPEDKRKREFWDFMQIAAVFPPGQLLFIVGLGIWRSIALAFGYVNEKIRRHSREQSRRLELAAIQTEINAITADETLSESERARRLRQLDSLQPAL